MSSSRSITAARQKRAGEQGNMPPSNSRPFTSIASNSSFSQQQVNTNTTLKQQFSPKQQQQQQQQTQNSIANPKISLANAIALITLRLSRLEKLIQENQEGGISILSGSENSGNLNKETLDTVMNRIVLLENKINMLSNLTKDHKELKQFVTNMNNKTNTSITNLNNQFTNKLLEHENTLIAFENKLDSMHNSFDGNSIQVEQSLDNDNDNDNDEEEEDFNMNTEDNNIVSANIDAEMSITE